MGRPAPPSGFTKRWSAAPDGFYAAEAAGLTVGRIVSSVDGVPVRTADELQRAIWARVPGDQVSLGLGRADAPGGRCFPEAEGQWQLVLRAVTAAAPHLGDLGPFAGRHLDGTDRVRQEGAVALDGAVRERAAGRRLLGG